MFTRYLLSHQSESGEQTANKNASEFLGKGGSMEAEAGLVLRLEGLTVVNQESNE